VVFFTWLTLRDPQLQLIDWLIDLDWIELNWLIEKAPKLPQAAQTLYLPRYDHMIAPHFNSTQLNSNSPWQNPCKPEAAAAAASALPCPALPPG